MSSSHRFFRNLLHILTWITPDRTIRSLISYQTWIDTSGNQLSEEYLRLINFDSYAPFTQSVGDTLKARSSRGSSATVKRWAIEEVKSESESRTIVTVRTSDSTMGIYNQKQIRMVRYALMKDGNRWLIESGKETCYTCDGTGKMPDYSNLLEVKKKRCDACGGEGWMNLY